MPPSKSHPLKRISTGSLTSLARSQQNYDPNQPPSSSSGSSGLEFLEPAITEIADEAATLASNIQNMTRLHDALGTFNESFAGYLYALKMNAFCVEWPEAPDERSFARAPSLLPPPPAPLDPFQLSSQQPQQQHHNNQADTTYATVYSTQDDLVAGGAKGTGVGGKGKGTVGTGIKKPGVTLAGGGGKPSGGNKLGTVAERKKREAAVNAIIDTLPLEFRGGDANTRIAMEKVLTQLLLHPEGRKISDIVSPIDLPQARVNKCLIALVNKKTVGKQSLGGVAVYKLK